MESAMCDSPNKNKIIHDAGSTSTPPGLRTPVRKNDRKQRLNGFANGIAGFNVLPAHITPPSGLTKFIARNPFDADLTSRLHLSVISPTVFTKKVTPKSAMDSPGFSWSVDELALIRPASIEEFPNQQTHCSDPDIELVAQAAIEKFFTEKVIIPSPWNTGKKAPVGKVEMQTPSRPLVDLNLTRDNNKNKRDCWTQTVLTLPPVLPKEVEEVLKPFFTFNQDQNAESDDANSSNGSLRRKLFFNHDDCTEDEDETSFCMSPSKSLQNSMIHLASPPQSGMLVHGTPLRGNSYLGRTHGTPYAGNVSPPNMSPICNGDMSYQSIRSRCQVSARLDFTADMSVDTSVRDGKELKRIEDLEGDTNTSMIRSNIFANHNEYNGETTERSLGEEERDIDRVNETLEMLSREATPLKRGESPKMKEKSVIWCTDRRFINDPKIDADWSKIRADSVDFQQRNGHSTLLGNSAFGQQSDVNSAQDTGYQTYSMSNLTGNTNTNCSNSVASSCTKTFDWGEKIASHGEQAKLSDWQNIRNMFSSTPSKYSRRREYENNH